jgi:MarR family transcriptional regulator, lower aerobic nicotinate degradation pathway regulator
MKREDGQLGVVDALAQLSFLVQGALGRIAAEHELSIIQVRLLGVLRDRSPGMNELAHHLELDKSSVTGLVDRATRRGLVRRKVSSADRRAVEVSITAAGRKVAQRVEAEFERRIASLVQVLTESERADLSDLASRVVIEDARRHGIELE